MKTMSMYNSFILLMLCQILLGCVDRPVVEHSLNNASFSGPYPVGTIVEVVCDKGYAPVGNAYFTCNGKHFVGHLACKVRTCPRIDTPSNCRIVNEPAYEAGSVIIFDSNPGYVKVGQGTLLCREDNRWSAEHPPVCKPKECGHFGNITNGQTREINVSNGVRNAYGSVLRIDCDDGYVLNGQKYVRCQEDGNWESRSTCDPVKCLPFPGLYSSCVNTASLFLNHYYMNCKNDVSVTKVGGDNVQCQDNGTWSSESIGCFCDCKVQTDMTNMTFSNLNTKGYVPHGQTLSWNCKDGYVKNTTDVIRCNDGNMATPTCQLDIGDSYLLKGSPTNETNFSWLGIYFVGFFACACAIFVARYVYRRRTMQSQIQCHFKSVPEFKGEKSTKFLNEISETSSTSQTTINIDNDDNALFISESLDEITISPTTNLTNIPSERITMLLLDDNREDEESTA